MSSNPNNILDIELRRLRDSGQKAVGQVDAAGNVVLVIQPPAKLADRPENPAEAMAALEANYFPQEEDELEGIEDLDV